MASPFIGKRFTFAQPDGTEFDVRGWGDQHYAVFETPDGYTVVKNPTTGFYEVARVSADGTMLESAPGPQGNLDGTLASVQPGLRINREAARARGMEGALRLGGRRCERRREQRKSVARAARALNGPVMAPPQRGTVGDFVGLCLLIDFPDEEGTIPRDEVESFCNQRGYTGFGNSGSVSDYFRENSIGRCNYTNVVANYYRAQHPKSHYTDPAIPQGTRARQLIVEALTQLKAINFDFSRLTVDSGGFVYAMNIYYAGEVENNWREGLWPHAWHLGTSFELAPGKFAFDYQFTDMSQQLTLGTFCHENGHMLCDYPDLYDYGNESSGVGAYCLMCAGGNISEKDPTHISAYLKRLSGWANSVTPIQHNRRVTLTAGKNDFAIFSKNTSEYFIVENRQKSGRDKALPDEGLAIWHVDEDGDNSDEQMTPSRHYELSLEQADGEFTLESNRNHLGDGTDLYGRINRRFADATLPSSKWWDGTASNLDIFNVSPPEDTVTFTAKLFDDGGGGAEPVRGESSPNLEIPDHSAQGITDTITFDKDAIIAGVSVTLDIFHSFPGDLWVTLLTPKGDAIVLHRRNQQSEDDGIRRTIDESDVQTLAMLHGQSTKGHWGLVVQDLARSDVGTLNSWALQFDAASSSQGPVTLGEAAGTHIPDGDPAGIKRSLSTDANGNVDSIEVFVDITHPWIADLQISLVSPTGIEVVLHNQTGGDNDDIIMTYTPATTHSLINFQGEPIRGHWELKVADSVGEDSGKLNAWRLVIHPAS